MQHRTKAILIVAVALGAIVLAGFVGVSLKAEDLAGHYPNDRANHHPRHLNPNG